MNSFKKFLGQFLVVLAAFSLLQLVVIPLAHALPAEGKVGPIPANTGSPAQLRFGAETQLITGNMAGDFYEAASRGSTYTIKTASAGTSLTTAGTSPLAAGGTAWLALYNPNNSGYIAEIVSSTFGEISGTPGVGSGVVYDLGCGQNITASQNATPVNSKDGSAGHMLGFTQTALTGSGALKELATSCYQPFAAAAAGVVNITCTDDLRGRFVLFPGCALAEQTTAAGTTHVATGTLTYTEHPLTTP